MSQAGDCQGCSLPGWPILWPWNDFKRLRSRYAAVQLKRVLMAKISLIVNGNPVNANVDPRTLLVQFLRENLRLTGTHVGCDTSQCGACVVHLDAKAVKSCTTLADHACRTSAQTDDDLTADWAAPP